MLPSVADLAGVLNVYLFNKKPSYEQQHHLTLPSHFYLYPIPDQQLVVAKYFDSVSELGSYLF